MSRPANIYRNPKLSITATFPLDAPNSWYFHIDADMESLGG
jgi:hypothetical protein